MMWPDPIGLGLVAVLNFAPNFDVAHVLAARPGLVGVLAGSRQPTFKPLSREVSNWRSQAIASLDRPFDFAMRMMANPGRDAVPRCVRLNNYWCIKKAGWAGEIAADAEGHVAFASAGEGAIVAAKLLRRYYLDFGRHDALAIVAHWAPAQCGAVAFHAAPHAVVRSKLMVQSSAAGQGLARFGLGNTLRARWLAAHGRGGTLRQTAKASTVTIHRSIVHDIRVTLKPAPAIMVGMGGDNGGGKDIALSTVNLASLSSFEGSLGTPMRAQPDCPGETVRIRNYALHAIEGIAARPDDDLQLFSADGTPGRNLLPLMVNMAKVEIGPLGARTSLIAAAIAAAFPAKGPDATTAAKSAP